MKRSSSLNPSTVQRASSTSSESSSSLNSSTVRFAPLTKRRLIRLGIVSGRICSMRSEVRREGKRPRSESRGKQVIASRP